MEYALVKDVEAGFEAASEKINLVQGDFGHFKKNLESMAAQIKKLGRVLLSQKNDGLGYNGFWETEDEAKEFGVFVFKYLLHKDMNSGSNEDGGALVPDHLQPRMIDMLGKYGKFRQYASRIQLGTSKAMVPKLTSDLTVYCPGEGQQITASDLAFGLVGIDVKKLACMTVVSSELEEDAAVGLGEIIARSVVRSLAKKEDMIGFVGDGTSTYFGMKGIIQELIEVDADPANIAGLQVASGNLYSEITLDDFEGLVARLPEDVDDGAAWYVSKKFFFSVMYKLARAAGAADMFSILTSQKERYFMGYPVRFVSAMPSAAADSQICAILGDLSMGCYLGERRDLRIERSNEVLFTNDQVAIKATQRVDLVTYGVGDTTNPGPICGLITAAG